MNQLASHDTTGVADRWPVYSEAEVAAAMAVLRSGRVNQWTGSEVTSFAEQFAARMGCAHGVAMANGSLALELALRALGIGPGDDVVVPCRSFMATASSVQQVGANPVFADVDANSQCLSPATLAAALTPATRAVVVVHLAGWPVDVEALRAVCPEPAPLFVEDCAQAHGALLHGRPVGGSGALAAWSFCQDKIMSTGGEGGMVTTNDRQLFAALWSLKDHGKALPTEQHGDADGQFRWLHDGFGTNARMTELQAAIGRVQLGLLDGWLARRREVAAALAAACREAGVFSIPDTRAVPGHAWYRFDAFVDPTRLAAGWDRDRLVRELLARDVACGTGVCPEIYLEAAFADTAWRPPQRLPVARRLGETSLMFPVFPTRTDATLERICATIATVGREAAR